MPVQQMIITKCIPSPLRLRRRLARHAHLPTHTFFHSGRFLNPKGGGCLLPVGIHHYRRHTRSGKSCLEQIAQQPASGAHVLLASPKRPYPGAITNGSKGSGEIPFAIRVTPQQ